jgi:hypothetical protein
MVRSASAWRLIAIATALTAAVLLAVPAQGMAVFKFGSKLDPSVQPSNAGTAHECDQANPTSPCSWVMNEAYGRPNGGQKAPRGGVIRRIRVIAGEAGSFRLQIVRAHQSGPSPNNYVGKVVRRGPVIHYQGQTQANFDNDIYNVESFRVKIPIRKGDRLAERAAKTSTLRCSSGGPNTLLFEPPLALGGDFAGNSDHDGCWMLIEAVARKRRHR